jgi:hypothetical protein
MEHNPFLEFVKDKDEYTKARFLALARLMISEGRRPIGVLMAMLQVGFDIAFEERSDELLDYLTWLSDLAEQQRAKVAEIVSESDARARAIVEAEDAV